MRRAAEHPDAAAAFPSLHAAYPLLAALALWPVTRRGAAAAEPVGEEETAVSR